jgi:hypothetical protein
MTTTTVATVATLMNFDQYSALLLGYVYVQSTEHEDASKDADEVTADSCTAEVEFAYCADCVV